MKNEVWRHNWCNGIKNFFWHFNSSICISCHTITFKMFAAYVCAHHGIAVELVFRRLHLTAERIILMVMSYRPSRKRTCMRVHTLWCAPKEVLAVHISGTPCIFFWEVYQISPSSCQLRFPALIFSISAAFRIQGCFSLAESWRSSLWL